MLSCRSSFVRIVLASCALLGWISTARAEPIPIAAARLDFRVPVLQPLEALAFSVGYPPEIPSACGPCPLGPIVLEQVFRPTDVGISVTATAASDPDFGAFTALLANNQPDTLLFFFDAGSGRPDLSGFGRYVLDTTLFPDLSPFRISSLMFVLTQFSYDASNPIIVEGTPYALNVLSGELRVFAEPPIPTPEPATMTLLGIGLAAGVWRARRGRRLLRSQDVGGTDPSQAETGAQARE